jgi:ATP-dependent RNA helicase DeaD
VVKQLLAESGRRVMALIGGANPARQQEQLKLGVEVVVGTPSRVADFVSRGSLGLNLCRAVVFDEVDRLAETTHRADVVALYHACAVERWVVACSATPEPTAKDWCAALMRNPEVIELATSRTLPETLKHQVLILEQREHLPTLRKLLVQLNPEGAIAFFNRTADIDWLVAKLRHHGLRVAGLHAGMGKLERTETMRAFRAGRLQLLVATELAARGLDLGRVSLVLNLDLPHSTDNYVHRVGRTARMGREGLAITFVDPKSVRLLSVLEKELAITFERPVYRFGEIRLPTPEDLRTEARRLKAQAAKAKAKPPEKKGETEQAQASNKPKKKEKSKPALSKLASRQAAKGKARKAERKARGLWKPARKTEQPASAATAAPPVEETSAN